MNSNRTVFLAGRVYGRRWASLLIGLSAVILLISGCRKQQAAPPPRSAVPVSVAKVEQKTVPVEVTAIGNVEAYSTVSIKAQVPGQLMEVHFQEGDFVRTGQLLFTIDPRPYEADLARAEAQLARDKAVAENNRVQAQRFQQLFDAGIGTRDQADTSLSTASAADATVRADEAAIQTAKLNLEYTKIYSPIDGRTGYLMLKPGNLVKVADVPIVVINQVNPILVNFAVPQQYLFDIRKYMSEGSLRVSAMVPNDPGGAEQGMLTFIDNSVDATTGTIHLRATFANSRNQLWPGLYVNTVLRLSEVRNATIVPAQAISAGQTGQLVYVVKSDGTVESRAVVTSRTVGGDAVIEKGVQAGETVVTDGQLRLVPGARVEIKNGSNEQAEPLVDPPAPGAGAQGGGKRELRAKP